MNIFSRTLLAACSLALAAASQAAQPAKYVWVGPTAATTYNLNIGDTISLQLWAIGTPSVTQVDGYDAAMQWTSPTVTNITSYTPVFFSHDGHNHFDFSNSVGQAAITATDINTNVTLNSSGTEIGVITFTAMTNGTSVVSITPESTDDPNFINPTWFGVSQVYTTQPGLNGGFQPDFGSAITLNVGPVPEPASLACLGLGAAALLRRRKARKTS